jgi:hypothetical protein
MPSYEEGDSDGASTIRSEAPPDLGGTRLAVGDIDHEQYFGAPRGPATSQPQTSL